MTEDTIPADATLRTIWRSLGDPGKFIPAAFGVIHRYEREEGPTALRIGVTGTGKAPNYRIDRANSNDMIEVFDGNTHEPWPKDSGVARGSGTWSNTSMTYDQVRQLLADLRAEERARR